MCCRRLPYFNYEAQAILVSRSRMSASNSADGTPEPACTCEDDDPPVELDALTGAAAPIIPGSPPISAGGIPPSGPACGPLPEAALVTACCGPASAMFCSTITDMMSAC